jgi:hypothetical protein
MLLFGAAPTNLASLILAIRTTRIPGIPSSIPTQTSPSTRMILRDNFLTEFYNNNKKKSSFSLTLCSPDVDVLYVDNLAVFPAEFRAGGL